MKKLLFYVLVLSLAFNSCKNKTTLPPDRYVVILSMDGFRWDYASRTATPNLDKIAQNGVKAESLIPSFPTTTFANHYTIATGLYPDHHGILVNRFYAPEFDSYYNDWGNRTTVGEGKYYGGEPIWVTAENQNVKSATNFWVGSEADIMGIRPSYWKDYDHDFPYSQRIDTVIHWLSLPQETRPKLVMWYFDEPDSSGHDLGPENDSILPLITRLDSLVGVFITKMEALPIANQIDFIVVSDHGMAQLSHDRKIILDQYVDTSMIAIVDGWNPTMNIKVKEGYLDEVVEKLKSIPNLKVWKKNEAPEHLHFGTHLRLHDLTILADDGWSIYWSYAIGDARGTHGFDNKNTDVHAIFYAMGPDFKTNYVSPSFQNIHIYPLMAHLLNLQPAKVDGNLDSIRHILK